MTRAGKESRLFLNGNRGRVALSITAALMVSLALPMAAPAQPITSDSRIKTFVYNPNEVFSITTHYGYQSNIEFAQKENIETISVGDRVAWQVIPAGRRLFIRALEENARTNMTIVTNQRAYQFELRSSASNAVVGSEALTYVVRFFYPTDALANTGMTPPPIMPSAPTPAPAGMAAMSQTSAIAPVISNPLPPVNAAPAPAPSASLAPKPATPLNPAPTVTANAAPVPTTAPEPLNPIPAPVPYAPTKPAPKTVASATPANPAPLAPIPSLEPLEPAPPLKPITLSAPPAAKQASSSMNYRYTFSGPNDLAPLKIYDDGRTTYLKLPNTSMPRVSAQNTNGWAEVSSRRTAEGLVAIDTVAKTLRIKQANGEVMVFNEAGGEVQ